MSSGAKKHSLTKRTHLRVKPDPLDAAFVDFQGGETFTPELIGYIVDEAPMGGCSLLFHKDARFEEGKVYRLKVGQLAPLFAEIRWIKPIKDENLIRVGFQFLD